MDIFFYRFVRSNLTYGTTSVIFSLVYIIIAIENLHCACERNIGRDWTTLTMHYEYAIHSHKN